MRWFLLSATGLLLIAGATALRAETPVDVPLYGPTFKVGGLKFTVPSRWQVEPVANPASRAGQWHVPPPRGREGESGEVVVFYFGPGLGGGVRENAEAWDSAVTDSDGQPVALNVKAHTINGIKISQVALFGIYSKLIPFPGIPPQAKADYGLLGAVIENPLGNICWRFTGPEPLVTASLPLFNKIIDSVKLQDK